MNSFITDATGGSSDSVGSVVSKDGSYDISCIESITATARREALSIAIRDNDDEEASGTFEHEIPLTESKLCCGPSRGTERLTMAPRRDSRRPILERIDKTFSALYPSVAEAEVPRSPEKHSTDKIIECVPSNTFKPTPSIELPTNNRQSSSFFRLLSFERRVARPGAFRISPSDQILTQQRSEATFHTTATDSRFREATDNSNCGGEVVVDAELVAHPVLEMAKVVLAEANNVHVSEPAFDTMQNRKSKHAIYVFCCILICITVILSTAIIFLGRQQPSNSLEEGAEYSITPSFAPTTPSEKWLIEQIIDLLPLSSQAAMGNFESPQYKAIAWLQKDRKLLYYPMERMLQRYALATFYFATSGPDKWAVSKFWLTHPDECNWYTTSDRTSICNADGLVSHLELKENGLYGSLPEDISLLSILEVIDFGSNSLVGEIPTSLFKLKSLSALDLSSNVLSSEIPREIGRLASLRFLNISSNPFKGRIPTSLALLKKLEVFNAINTHLDGTLPLELASLSRLRVFAMGSTHLSGSLSTELANLQNLEIISLDGNCIIGTIPTEIAHLAFLDSFDLSRNFLEGSIPPELILAPNLIRLALSSNDLSGSFPMELTRSTSLEIIEISQNLFHGTIPTEIGLMSNVKQLLLDGNNWNGTLPTEIGLMTDLVHLTVSGLSGKVPSEFCALRFATCISPGNADFCSCD